MIERKQTYKNPNKTSSSITMTSSATLNQVSNTEMKEILKEAGKKKKKSVWDYIFDR